VTSDPLITVIIPTYNRDRLILDAIGSVVAQTWSRWELIVVDDGSTDRTASVLARLDDPRIRVIRSPHSGLAAVARNRGLAQARGTYVAFLDSDDAWLPGKLETQRDALSRARHCRWSYTLFEHMDERGAFLPALSGGPWPARSGWVLEPLVRGTILPMIQTVMAETALLRELGGFDERPDFREDFHLCARLAAASEAVAVDAPLTRIRHHDGRTTFGLMDVRRWKVRALDHLATTLPDPRIRRVCREQAAAELRDLAHAASWTRDWRSAGRAWGEAVRRHPLSPRGWTTALRLTARWLRPAPQPGPTDGDLTLRIARLDVSGAIGSLWPDVPLSARWAAHRRLTDVTAAVLQGRAPVALYDDGHPRAVGIAAFLAGLGPLLGHWVATGTVATGEALAALLAEHLAHGRRRAERLGAAFDQVRQAFLDRGVTPIALKALHTGAEYFPEPGLRPANDFDLAVFPHQAAAARAALAACGLVEVNRQGLPWRSEWAPRDAGPVRSVEMMHEGNPWRVDLHVALDRSLFPGRVAGLGPVDASQVTPCARLGAGTYALAHPQLAAYLAFHTSAHFPAVPLIRIVELVHVIRRDVAAGTLIWPALLERLDERGLTPLTYPAFALVERLAPGVVPPAVGQAMTAAAPPRLRRAVARLDPGRALHTWAGAAAGLFVWTSGPREMLRDVAIRIWPPDQSGYTLRGFARAYRRRVRRLFSQRA
jgi:glycosyltransferase involved in cell wall biosynthesis